MSDLQDYIEKRRARDPEFAQGFDSGYERFKIGVLLEQARLQAGLTQEEPARRRPAVDGAAGSGDPRRAGR